MAPVDRDPARGWKTATADSADLSTEADTSGCRVTGPLLQGSYLHPESLKTDTLLQQAPEQQLTVQPLPDAAQPCPAARYPAHRHYSPQGPIYSAFTILASLTLQAVGNSLDQLPDRALRTQRYAHLSRCWPAISKAVLNQQLNCRKADPFFLYSPARHHVAAVHKIDWFNLNSRTTQVTTIAFPPLAITAAPGSGDDTPTFDAAPKMHLAMGTNVVPGRTRPVAVRCIPLIWYYRQNKACTATCSVTLWLQLRQALRDND